MFGRKASPRGHSLVYVTKRERHPQLVKVIFWTQFFSQEPPIVFLEEKRHKKHLQKVVWVSMSYVRVEGDPDGLGQKVQILLNIYF